MEKRDEKPKMDSEGFHQRYSNILAVKADEKRQQLGRSLKSEVRSPKSGQ
jgi:hypothetical protein